jgi:hypothetical protein
LVFAKFFELGSARQVMLWMRGAGMKLPANRSRRQVVWKEPNYDDVYRILTNPVYAGAYAYGRTVQRQRVVEGQLRSEVVRQHRADWSVLLRDHHEGYISWQQFERIEQMLAKNTQGRGGHGAARRGSTLLTGLVSCRRCGHRLGVNYSGTSQSVRRYTCDGRNAKFGDPKCISFSAIDVDVQIAKRVLAITRPAAIEAAQRAWVEFAGARDQAIEALELELEQAQYQTRRAERQFDAVDPENRTVARELEKRWNAALELERLIETRIDAAREINRRVDPPSVDHFTELASDLELVWNAATTDMALKKRIVRAVIEQIWADVDEARSEIVLTVHWKGGAHTDLLVPKRRSGERGRTTSSDVVEAVRVLARIFPDHEIAAWLGKAGIRTPNGANYTRALVASLRHTRGIPAHSIERRRADGWLSLEEAAGLMDVSTRTLRRAAQANEVPACHPLANGPWIFARSDLENEVAKRVTTRVRARRDRAGAGPTAGQLPLVIPRT